MVVFIFFTASEKRAFLLYYATPLLSSFLPSDHLFFLMLLTGGIFRLLKQSISPEELSEASVYLKLFTAQAPVFYGKNDMEHTAVNVVVIFDLLMLNYCIIEIFFLSGKQFQTFNVHQLLHLPEVVRDLGPLWSNSCFPFEDYNGDLRDLFHGTKNVDGQVCV